jgi:hypothetical protein
LLPRFLKFYGCLSPRLRSEMRWFLHAMSRRPSVSSTARPRFGSPPKWGFPLRRRVALAPVGSGTSGGSARRPSATRKFHHVRVRGRTRKAESNFYDIAAIGCEAGECQSNLPFHPARAAASSLASLRACSIRSRVVPSTCFGASVVTIHGRRKGSSRGNAASAS